MLVASGSAFVSHLRRLKRYTSLYGLSMLLFDLPNELLQHISESLELERDINALTRTNRHLYNLLNPYLYRHNIRLFRSSALSWAAKRGQEGTAQKLLGARADTKTRDEHGYTPLLLAIMKGHKTIVELLLAEDDFDLDSKDSTLPTLLLHAARRGYEAVIKLLLSKDDVDPDSKDIALRTPLWWAAEGGHEAVVKLLLRKGGVNPNAKDDQRKTPLLVAAQGG